MIESKKPDYVYDKENWEVTHTPGSFHEEVEYYEPFEVITMGCLRKLPDRYAVVTDKDGIRDVKWFDCEDEAKFFARISKAVEEDDD